MFKVDAPAEVHPVLRRDIKNIATKAAALSLLTILAGQLVQDDLFGGGDMHVALIRGGPFAGLLLSLWYTTRRGNRTPLQMYVFPEGLSRLLMVVIGIVGLALFAVQPLPGWVFAGVVALAAALAWVGSPFLGEVWGAVYPKAYRGRIIAYGRMIHGLVGAFMLYGVAWTLEKMPRLYSMWFIFFGALSFWAVWHFGRLRLPTPRRDPDAPSVRILRILAKDREFVKFQVFQFILGFANLGASPLLAVYVKQEMGLPLNLQVLVVNQGVMHMVLILLSVRFHGALFDRLGVVRHRALTSLLMAAGWTIWAFTDSLWSAILASALIGLGHAGGNIVWLIGSLYFARQHEMSAYTGIHTFLTGVRGVVAPWIWIGILTVWDLPRTTIFGIAAGLIVFSAIGHGLFVKVPDLPEEKATDPDDESEPATNNR